MKQILILFLLTIPIHTFAQPEGGVFSEEPEEFIKELSKMLDNTRREESKDVAGLFEENYETGQFTESQIADFRKVANEMLNRKMRAYPHFTLYLKALNESVLYQLEGAKFNNWHQSLHQVLFESKSRDYKALERHLKFSIDFFQKDAIYASNTKSWGTDNRNYNFGLTGGQPFIEYPSVNLMGYTTGDTVMIYDTRGRYLIFDKIWQGESGKITWESAGLPRDEIFVTFDEYELDVTDSDFAIDTVTMHYGSLMSNPIPGRLEHKLLINKSATNTTYPYFHSFQNSFKIEDVVPMVDFEGGFEIRGREILGSGAGDLPSRLTFYNEKGEVLARASSKSFIIDKSTKIAAKQAEIRIYFAEDSIYHPGLNLKYRVDNRELSATTGEAGITRSRFFDSYHAIEMDIERMSWKLGGDDIYLTVLTAGEQNPAFFESFDLFERRKFERYQGVTSYNPIGVLKRLSERLDTREISAHAVAKAFNPNLTVDQIQRSLYQLVEDGFIFYDSENEMVIVKDKIYNYLWASAKVIDYDVIKIESLTDKPNAVIDLKNNAMTINGVYSVPLSQTQFVVIFPKLKEMKLLENRDMQFSGTVFGGRLDFFGKDYYFSYDRFDIELNDLDSMAINVPTGEIDQYGQPELVPIETVFENLNGRLYIDDPGNKSGAKDLSEYPKFENRKPSFAYYDKNSKFVGVYDRENFFFEVNPFVIDSLDNFDIYTQKFPGTLHSAGIFPEFQENLMVMGDRSMGFVSETPPEGFPLYGGLGHYYNVIDLSNRGFRGKGKIEFLSSTSQSEDILFFPDSLNASLQNFAMARDNSGSTAYPSVTNGITEMHWEPYNDMMAIRMVDEPFNFFDDYGTLAGNLQLKSTGLEGDGLFDWEDATLSSSDFRFGQFSIDADTSELKIKALDKTKVAFNLPNVKSHVDFGEQHGNFKSNEKDIPTELPYNQYSTTMNEFDWDIEQRMITFKPPADREFSTFTSTHPNQFGLAFDAKGGTYDLNNYLLNVTGVPYISVADAHIQPGDGTVVIEADAKMRQFSDAVIFADSLNRQYQLYDATVKILSKRDYRASGYYDYVNRSNEKQVIHFQEIGVTGSGDTLTTFAEATITDTAGFHLDPMIAFQGTAALNAQNHYMQFNGISKLNVLDRDVIETDWFKIEQQVKPVEVKLNATETEDQDGNDILTGIHLRSDSTNLYATIMGNKFFRSDKSIFLADGVVTYDEGLNEFVVGPEERIEGKTRLGNMLTYNNETQLIQGEGVTDLGLDMELVTLDAAGTVKKAKEDTTFYFNMILGLDFFLTPEVRKMMREDLSSVTFDEPDVDYFREDFQQQFVQFLGNEQNFDRWLNKLNKTGAFSVPGDIDYLLVLTDVKMIWDPYTGSYRSQGRISLATVDGEMIGKQMKGYVEFGVRRRGDFFNIYLETDHDDWYFFTFQKHKLQILSSNVEFNDLLMSIKPKDRRLKGEKGEYITFSVSNPAKKFSFVERMKYYENN